MCKVSSENENIEESKPMKRNKAERQEVNDRFAQALEKSRVCEDYSKRIDGIGYCKVLAQMLYELRKNNLLSEDSIDLILQS